MRNRQNLGAYLTIMNNLSIQQQNFCLSIFQGKSAGTAYIENYPVKNINTANSAGSRLLKRVEIQDRIAELRKKAEDDSVADVLERKQLLTELIRGRIGDFIDPLTGLVDLTPERLRHPAIHKVKETTVRGQYGWETSTEITLHNQIAAIETLNKMDGSNAPERHESISAVIIGSMTDDELLRIASNGHGNHSRRGRARIIEAETSEE